MLKWRRTGSRLGSELPLSPKGGVTWISIAQASWNAPKPAEHGMVVFDRIRNEFGCGSERHAHGVPEVPQENAWSNVSLKPHYFECLGFWRRSEYH